MDERVLQFRVGVMVVSAAMITIALVVMLTDVASPFRSKRTIFVQFPEAPGVTIDTPIRKSGVLIGRVSDVTLIDQGVIITAKIEDQYALHTNELCRITSETILGDAVLEFIPISPKGENVTRLEDGAYISGVVATNPLEAVEGLQETFDRAAESFIETSSQVASAASGISTVVDDNEEQVSRVLQKAETAMAKIEAAAEVFNRLAGDEEVEEKLRAALDELPGLVSDARTAMQSVTTTADEFGTTVKSFNDTAAKLNAVADEADLTFQNATTFTAVLAEKGDGIVTDIEGVADQMDLLLSELLVFSKNLNNSEGSVGQFVNNPELYQKLNRSADNIELLTRRLRPIVEDVRVFSDKIARDPGRLGLKGALQRGGTGTKHLPASYQQPYYKAPGIQPGLMSPGYPSQSYAQPPQFSPQPTTAPQTFWNTQ